MDHDLSVNSPVVVTGAAGFIGAHVSSQLLRQGVTVVGVDAFTEATGPAIKRARVAALCAADPRWTLHEFDISQPGRFADLILATRPSAVIHLAAQPGIRRSFEDPRSTVQNNLVGFHRVIDACCGLHPSPHLLYASSSSVYGGHEGRPSNETRDEPRPQSLYASTKLANEWTAQSMAHSRGLHSTGMRLFTVYGPWGRPDMALTRFATSLQDGAPIHLRGHGAMERDFTYVEDTAAAIIHLTRVRPAEVSHTARVVNVGAGRPVSVRRIAELLAHQMGETPQIVEVPEEAGEVLRTWACVEQLEALGGQPAATPLAQGVKSFADWFSTYRTHRETG